MAVALLTFLAAATLVIVAPGPDTLLVTRNVFRRGRRGGLVTAAGTVTGLALWSVAAAFGLSALLAASEIGYDVVRVAGGLYLVWLGVQSLRSQGAVPTTRSGTLPMSRRLRPVRPCVPITMTFACRARAARVMPSAAGPS